MDKKKEFNFLLIVILIGFCIRLFWINTLMERDEGSFGYIASRIVEGETLFDVNGNKPPLIYYTYAASIYLFGNSIIPVRILNNILFLVSIVIFYNLSKHIFNKKISRISTIFYTISSNIPIFEGQLALTESFVVFSSLLSLLFFINFIKKKQYFLLILSSFFVFISCMYKQTGIILYVFYLIQFLKKKIDLKQLNYYFFPIGLLLFMLIMLKKNWLIFLIALSKVSVDYFKYIQYVPFEYFFLILSESLFLSLFCIIGLFYWRGKNDWPILWLILSFIISIIPNSYGHYYLQLVPSASIIAGFGFYRFMENASRKKLLFVMLIFLVSFFFQSKHIPNYHATYVFGEIRFTDSDSYYDQIALSNFIKNNTNKSDEILIWGDEPGIAWLSERKFFEHLKRINCDTYNTSSAKKALNRHDNNLTNKIKLYVVNNNYKTACEGFNLFDFMEDYKPYKFSENISVYIKKD